MSFIKQFCVIFLIWFTASAMSIYDITFENIKTGEPVKLSSYRGKVIMIVNTASLCGFSTQYTQLEEIWQKYKDKNFILIAIPTNDFGSQEPGGNQEIATFCERNFNTTFNVVRKITSKGKDKHDIFKLINTDFSDFAGPMWNFYKYIYSPSGEPLEWFSSLTKPDSKKITNIIEKHLK